MDESTKLRMNLMAIQKVDPYAKEILDSCPHVAFYKYFENEWQKSEIEGSFFVYSRVAEPLHSIFINNRLNTNSLVEPLTKPIEMQSQPPFLLYRNQRQAITGFWFYCKEDCVRIHALLEKLIKKVGNSNAAQHNNVSLNMKSDQQQFSMPPQPVNSSQNLSNGGKKQEVDIFSMLSKAQAEFNHSNGPIESQFNEMKIGQQQQQQQQQPSNHQPLMKQLSSAMPDITSPNVVNFFAAAQQPNGVVGIDIAHSHGGGPPTHFPNATNNPLVPPVQTLDEIEKQHRVSSSISPKVSEQKLLNNLLHSAVANSSSPIIQQPKVPIAVATKQPQQQVLKQPTLITPAMFQAPSSVEDKVNATTSSSTHHRPEPLTQNQLIQALNYLLENDPDFIHKIHEAYIKSFNKKVSH